MTATIVPVPAGRLYVTLDCGHTSVKTAIVRVEGLWPERERPFLMPTAEVMEGSVRVSPLLAPIPGVDGLQRGFEGGDTVLGGLQAQIRKQMEAGGSLARSIGLPGSKLGLAVSVPAGLRTALISRLEQEPGLRDVSWCVLSPLDDWPVRNDYSTPHTVGPDRLAASVGAAARAASPDALPILVVTVGTAITVNLVTPASMDVSSRSRVEILQSRENRRPSFQGGAILPGYQAFLRSLSAAAPTLAPAIQEILAHPDWTTDGFEDLHPTLAGATTPGNLRRGALEGVAGAVAQNLASVESEVGVEPGTLAVWITGGDADALHSGLRRMAGVNRRAEVVSDLVLEGLGLTLDWLLSPARDA